MLLLKKIKHMNFFDIREIVQCSATDIWAKRTAMRGRIREYSSQNAIEKFLRGSNNASMVEAVSSVFFDNKCKTEVWDYLEIPYTHDSMLFLDDIVSDNGKLVMVCREIDGDQNAINEAILEAVFTCFLTTQRPIMYYFRKNDPSYLDGIKIDDQFKFLFLLNKDLFEITLTSPEVIWMYISHKLKMSENCNTAREFDSGHPQEHKFDMLKCAFKCSKLSQ